MAFTYFFRDMSTLKAIQEHVVPAVRNHRYIKIWDAGCATGPETYSLAIVLREALGPYAFRRVTILATDLDEENGQFGEMVRRGEYPKENIKRLPREIVDRYFSKDNRRGVYRVSDELKRRVTFQQHDLRSLRPVSDYVNLVLCKNVLLHLSEETRAEVIRMFHKCLVPDGYLVTEQTQQMPSEVRHLFRQILPNVRLFQKVS